MSKLITVPIFDVDVHLFKDRTEAKEFFRGQYPGDDDTRSIETSRGVCITNEQCRMLCVFDGGLPIAAHESVHMAWAILKECGVKINAANDEPLAYLAAWLVAETMAFVNSDHPVAQPCAILD